MIIRIVNTTSNHLKRPQKVELVNSDSAINRTTNKKTRLKGGSVHEIGEINDEYLDEIY